MQNSLVTREQVLTTEYELQYFRPSIKGVALEFTGESNQLNT